MNNTFLHELNRILSRRNMMEDGKVKDLLAMARLHKYREQKTNPSLVHLDSETFLRLVDEGQELCASFKEHTKRTSCIKWTKSHY